MTGLVKGFADTANLAVHHAGGADDVGTSIGLGHSQIGVGIECGVVINNRLTERIGT